MGKASLSMECPGESSRKRSGGLCLRAADSDRLEPALRMSEQIAALDNAHFLGAARRGALQHGEDGRDGMGKRIRRVRSPNAGRYVERGEEIAGAVRADRQFGRRPAKGAGSLNGNRVDLSVRRIGELGGGDDDGRWTARDQL